MESIQCRGRAKLGDKTVLDAMDAALGVLRTYTPAADSRVLFDRICAAVAGVVESGAQAMSQRGRAAWVGERSRGHKDPGQVAFLRLVETIARLPIGESE